MRRYCDLLIALAYMCMPTAIFVFVHNVRAVRVRNCQSITISTVTFIYACGAAHLWESSATLLSICALSSLYMVTLLSMKMRSATMTYAAITSTESEAKSDYSVAEDHVCDMLSIHSAVDYKFLQVNDACVAYGYAPSTLMCMSILDLVHPEDRPSIEAGLSNIEEDGVGESFIYRLRDAQDSYVNVETTCKMGAWENRPSSFLVTRNIQRRLEKFQRDTLVHVDAMRVETNRIHASALAHDLRTSLSVFDLAVREIHLGGDVKESLGSIDESLWLMKFILDRTITSCTVLQGHKPVPHLEEICVGHIVHHVINMLSTYPHSVSIECDIAPEVDSCTLLCDADWLTSIMASFISNAYDNTMYGRVKVSVRNVNDWMCFEVLDTGVGVTESDMNKLFSPFSKLFSKLKIEHGIGIGLYNCAWRIRLLGGTYGVHINEEGGCTFHFKLPLVHQQATLIRKKRPTKIPDVVKQVPATPPARVVQMKLLSPNEQLVIRVKVLIVDDTTIFRTLMRKQLERRGIEKIDEAADGEQALQMMKDTAYDVVVMDVMMPFMNGDDCAREYRLWEVQHRSSVTPIILMSADVYSPENDILSSGAVQDFFQKPINFARLGSAIHDIAAAAIQTETRSGTLSSSERSESSSCSNT